MNGSSSRMRVGCLCLLMAGALLTAGGCAAGRGGNLRISSSQAGETYQQMLPAAYTCRNAVGDIDVVLTSDNSRNTDGATTSRADLRQVMHIRVLWRPMRGTKRDHPSATNATISWYVFNNGNGGAPEMIEYTGAAFVDVTPKGNVTRLDIYNATMRPNPRHVGLNDPIGPSKLQGTVFARQSPRQVNEVLNQVKSAIAAVHASERPSPQEASSHLPVEP